MCEMFFINLLFSSFRKRKATEETPTLERISIKEEWVAITSSRTSQICVTGVLSMLQTRGENFDSSYPDFSGKGEKV